MATTDACPHERQTAWKEAGAEVVVLPATGRGTDLNALVDELARRSWLEVMCEGGGELATSLLRDDLVDRIELFHGAVVVGSGGSGIGDIGVASIDEAPRFRLVAHQRLGNDLRSVYEKETD